MRHISFWRSTTSLLLIAGYLALSVWSVFHMSHMAAHGMPMADCPYLTFRHAPGNDIGSHLSAWHTFGLIVLPLAMLFGWFWLQPTGIVSLLFRPFRVKGVARPPLLRPPIMLLFTSGILHAKAP